MCNSLSLSLSFSLSLRASIELQDSRYCAFKAFVHNETAVSNLWLLLVDDRILILFIWMFLNAQCLKQCYCQLVDSVIATFSCKKKNRIKTNSFWQLKTFCILAKQVGRIVNRWFTCLSKPLPLPLQTLHTFEFVMRKSTHFCEAVPLNSLFYWINLEKLSGSVSFHNYVVLDIYYILQNV